jgi:hypothetical protein
VPAPSLFRVPCKGQVDHHQHTAIRLLQAWLRKAHGLRIIISSEVAWTISICYHHNSNRFVGKTQYPKCKQGRVAQSLGRTIMMWEYMNKQKTSHLTKLESWNYITFRCNIIFILCIMLYIIFYYNYYIPNGCTSYTWKLVTPNSFWRVGHNFPKAHLLLIWSVHDLPLISTWTYQSWPLETRALSSWPKWCRTKVVLLNIGSMGLGLRVPNSFGFCCLWGREGGGRGWNQILSDEGRVRSCTHIISWIP